MSVILGRPFHEIRTWPAWEIALYEAYYKKHPLPWVRADVAAATIAQTVANAHRGKGQPARKLLDFALYLKEAMRSPLTEWQEIKARMMAYTNRVRRAAGKEPIE